MRAEVSIEFDYLEGRKNPAEVFEAMAMYINAYRDFGQLISTVAGMEADFYFQLNSIEKGSIISKLSAACNKASSVCNEVGERCERLIYSSANKLFEDLVEKDATESEEDVDLIAVSLEAELFGEFGEGVIDPYIDRKKLSFILERFSQANEKIQPGETVIISNNVKKEQVVTLNTSWRFLGNAKEMFLGKTESKVTRDMLYVAIPVNEGDSVWTFRSLSTNKRFSGKIMDREWLDKYQSGLIPPIGPKDVIDVKMTLDIYTPPVGKGREEIRSVKINNVFNVERSSEMQYELGS